MSFLNPIFRWLSRFASRETAPAARVPAAPLPYSRLTLDDWRSSPERVAYVASLLADPMFRELLGMLANLRPLPPRDRPLDATTAAVLLGQRTGHDQVIASLLAAGTSPAAPPSTDLAADYGAENVQALWEREGNA